MTGGIESKNNTEITQEEKRGKIGIDGGYDGLDTSSKKAFDTLKFDSKGKGEKYNESDVQKAIGGSIDEWITKNKLQSPEKEKADAIKTQLLSDMGGKDVKGMIESFASMRTELIRTMAVDSAKDAKGAIDAKSYGDTNTQSQEVSLQKSFEDKGKSLAELFLQAQKKAQDKIKLSIDTSNVAQKKGNIESTGAQENVREKITLGWPT